MDLIIGMGPKSGPILKRIILINTGKASIKALLLWALGRRYRIPVSISTIIIDHIVILYGLIVFILSGTQTPIPLSVPPELRRIATANVGDASRAAIDSEVSKLGPEWRVSPVDFSLAAVCCPIVAIPYACNYMHWSCWVPNPNICFVLVNPDGNIINREPEKEAS